MQISRRSLLYSATAGTFLRAEANQKRPPSVVLILADDLGYGDLGCYGSSIRTPNLDRMASEGVSFTNFTSANSVCSPSRAALLTGRYPTRTGVTRVLMAGDTIGLNPDEVTLADTLKKAGYRTACIGKWHLGRPEQYLPTNRGFDSYFGIPYSNDMKPLCLLRDTKVVEDPARLDTLTARYTAAAVEFIQESRRQPFFLYLPHTFPHIPLAASAKFRGRSAAGLYGDVVEELDWSTGEILAALRKNGLDEQTLVVFTSDNGPWYQGSPGRLRGRKGTSWEGGVREPLIARFPGRFPAGRRCQDLASMMDLFPTVAGMCGAPLPPNPLDGRDILPLLAGQGGLEREPLLTFDDVHLQCVRTQRWKLHLSRRTVERWNPGPPGGVLNLPLPAPELYDLDQDPEESYDVAAEHPDVVQKLVKFAEQKLTTLPVDIRAAYERAKTIQTMPTPAGAVPRVNRVASRPGS